MTEAIGDDRGLPVYNEGKGLTGIYADAILNGRVSGAQQIAKLIDAGTELGVLKEVFGVAVAAKQEFPDLSVKDPDKMHLAAQDALLMGQRTGVMQVHCEASNILLAPDGNVKKIREYVGRILGGEDIL